VNQEFTTKTRFLRNAWYMAAWSAEVGATLLRRRILGRAIVLFRREGGTVAALDDRCPHRFLPLSMGERRGDTIRCGYHGLTFDSFGKCVHNPFAEKVRNGAMVRAWPTAERDGIVWLWAGNADRADASCIPDFSAVKDGSGAPPIRGYQLMHANYEYGTDNLLDLSHIEFVHRGSFAGNGVIFAGKHSVHQDGDTLHSNWWMPDVAAPPHTVGVYERDMRTDHWLDMRWNAPASMLLEVGATAKGAPREQGVIVFQAHILTPETESTTHYFWETGRPIPVASPEGDGFVKALMAQAFDTEDKPVIEAAYANLDGGEFWAQKPVFIGVDAGGARARRVLEKIIAREAAEAS
jgi:phenylpropionate dioxygenase-like ring-hydroxylating dioxygenase large terminal subunit